MTPKSSKPGEPTPDQLSAYFSKIGRKGGKARLQTMTPEERTRIAKKAVQAREAKKEGRE
jgi:hypothetical protein